MPYFKYPVIKGLMFFGVHYCILLDIIRNVLHCLSAPSSCLPSLVVILSVIKNNKKTPHRHISGFCLDDFYGT